MEVQQPWALQFPLLTSWASAQTPQFCLLQRFAPAHAPAQAGIDTFAVNVPQLHLPEVSSYQQTLYHWVYLPQWPLEVAPRNAASATFCSAPYCSALLLRSTNWAWAPVAW